MLSAGLIEEALQRPDPHMDDQRRKYYRLTDQGSTVLAQETGRLAELVEIARQKHVLRTPKTV
jgi:DNA-binding PadR family transcriptional regulator